MLTPAQLLLLARAYGAAEGVGLRTIGKRACGNNKALLRLADGRGVTTTTAAAIEHFLRTNWPAGTGWPPGVPNPPRRKRCAAGIACVPGLKPGAA